MRAFHIKIWPTSRPCASNRFTGTWNKIFGIYLKNVRADSIGIPDKKEIIIDFSL